MFKKLNSILVSVLVLSAMYVYGMEEKNPVTNADLYGFDSMGNTIYLSLSSSEEEVNSAEKETEDLDLAEFHMMEGYGNCNMIGAVLKQPAVIIDDYQTSSNAEKPSDPQKAVSELGAFDWYTWAHNKLLMIGEGPSLLNGTTFNRY